MIEIDVPPQSMIVDIRKASEMKKRTITDYRKKEVIEVFKYSMANSKLEDSSKWLVELHCSGCYDEIWDEIITVYSRYININNFNLLEHIYIKYKYFSKYYNAIDKRYLLHLRNTQEIRNLLISVVSKMTLSVKNDIFDKRSVVKVKDFDFQKEGLLKNVKNTSLEFILSIIENEDCKELKLGVNEIGFHLRKTKSLNNCMFWYNWLCRLETLKKKDDLPLTTFTRSIKGVDEKYCKDWIWLLWKLIFKDITRRNNPELTKTIKYLYELYKINYKPSCKQKRKYLIFMAFYTIVISVDFKRENMMKPYLEIQASANINIIYRLIDYHLLKTYNDNMDFDKSGYKKTTIRKYQEEVEKKIKREEKRVIKEQTESEKESEETVENKMSYLDDLLFFKKKQKEVKNVVKYFETEGDIEDEDVKKIIYL